MRGARNLLVAQSGGPTAVINASLAGVIDEARRHPEIDRLYGGLFGIQGILEGQIADLGQFSDNDLEALAATPSALLGSCRYRLHPGDAERVLDVLQGLGIRYFLYAGGNDSADTAHRIAVAARQAGYDLGVVGIPKTVDNDLPITDHCPGYGSAARFVAEATMGAGRDTEAMRRTDPVKFIEVMGRDAGWLAAASVLGKTAPEDAPHLVYVPERPVSPHQVLEDVRAVYQELGYCVVVLSENQRDHNGRVLGSDGTPRHVDAFGHAYHDSPAAFLSRLVTEELGLRARYDRPGSIQRSLAACVSITDRQEALVVGRMAVRYALDGQTDCMVVLVRPEGEEYRCETATAPLEAIANRHKPLPREFIASAGNQITEAFRHYASPLIGGPLARHPRLR